MVSKTEVTLCRLCHLKTETLGHVIGMCSAGQRARIERHNWTRGQRELQITMGEVIPVGARGAIPQATVTGVKLGVDDRRSLIDFNLLAQWTSIDTCRGQFDYG
ncbi:hypothetical protein J6590_018970 [Homalodisca vitripennis]|nr:hypothetical protein J6590_018970 [Homalodisca vitripennis]